MENLDLDLCLTLASTNTSGLGQSDTKPYREMLAMINSPRKSSKASLFGPPNHAMAISMIFQGAP